MIIEKIYFSRTQPPQTNVFWARPVDGGFTLYAFNNGKWEPMKVMDDKGTSSTSDDEIADISNIPEIVEKEVAKQIEKLHPLTEDSVGTDEIIDDSVMLEDLNTEVKEKMVDTYSQEDESLDLGGLTL